MRKQNHPVNYTLQATGHFPSEGQCVSALMMDPCTDPNGTERTWRLRAGRGLTRRPGDFPVVSFAHIGKFQGLLRLFEEIIPACFRLFRNLPRVC